MTNAKVIAYLEESYKSKDLAFIEYVNQITWGYKVDLKRNKPHHNHTNNEQSV